MTSPSRLALRELLWGLAFAGGLMAFEAWFLRSGYFAVLFRVLNNEIAITLLGWAGVLFSFAATSAYVWASLTAMPSARWAYLALFTAIVMLQYGYWRALHSLVTADDLIMAIWGTSVLQKKTMAAVYGGWLWIVPCGAYALLLVTVRSRRRTGWKTLIALVGILIVVNAATLHPMRDGRLPLHTLYPTTSINGFFRALAELGWRWRTAARGGDREPVAFQAAAAPTNNVVLVVDESVRGDHLSLNGYARPTTPYLDDLARRGLITNWGIAVAGSNCSWGSNSLLLTGFPSTELPARRGEIHRWPSMMQYAKAMGYRTHFLNGHVDILWMNGRGDLRHVDQWLPRETFTTAGAVGVDLAIADRIVEIVDGSVGNFLWVNKAGVHFPYQDAFPEEQTLWQPSARGRRPPNEVPREALVNAYDNAIRYNVDGFLTRLDPARRRPGTVIVYTSDHGQALSERGEPWSHCGGREPDMADPHREALVPLVMIEAGRPGRDPERARDHAGHEHVFATLLDLFGFPVAERRHRYRPSLIGPEGFEPAPRHYYIGAIDRASAHDRRVRFPD